MTKSSHKKSGHLQGYAFLVVTGLVASFFNVLVVNTANHAEAHVLGDFTALDGELMVIEVLGDESYQQAYDRIVKLEKESTRVVTAYTSHAEQTDDTPCIAADGSDICKRYAAGEQICAANWVPLGTRVFVQGYGTCTVADRMSRKHPDRLDIYMGVDLSGARQFGKRNLKILEL